ncbi:MAG: hypothetical protein H7829_17095 [Magnetococcus sp. THC-1_WYH]
MNVLSIAQNVADEVGVPRPSILVSATDPIHQKIYRHINKVGTSLMRAHPWQELRKVQSITAVAQALQTSAVPSNFDRFIPETFWDLTGKTLINGPISPTEWASLSANSYADTAVKKFTVRAGDIYIIPTPTAGDSYSFHYVSKNWVLDQDTTTEKSSVSTDGDTLYLDDQLVISGVVYEFLRGEGQPFQMAAATFDQMFRTLAGNEETGVSVLTMGDFFGSGRHYSGIPGGGSTYSIYSGW